MMNFDIVISHKGCPDGLAARWCYYHYLKDRDYTPQYLEVVAGGYLDFVDYKDKKVLMLDICYKKEQLLELSRIVSQIVILDHHKSSYCELECDNIIFVYDIDRSGAQIAWDYFHEGIIRPWFIEMIADRDLWKWKYANSNAITTAMYSNGYYTNEGFDKLLEFCDSDIKKLKTQGKIMLNMTKSRVDYVCKKAKLFVFDETKICKMLNIKSDDNNTRQYNVYVVDAEHSIASEVGNKLSSDISKCDFAIVYRYDIESNQWFLSCRTCSDSVDLSVLCKKFRGGGHPRAAGFSLPNVGDFKLYFL